MMRNRWFTTLALALGLLGGCVAPGHEPVSNVGDAGAVTAALASTGAAWAYVEWNGSSYSINASRSYNPFGTTTVDNTYAGYPYYRAIVSFGQSFPTVENYGTWMVTAVSPSGLPVRCATARGDTHCVQQSANGTQTRVNSSFVIAYYRNNETSSGKTGVYAHFDCTASNGCTNSQYVLWTSAGGNSINGWNMAASISYGYLDINTLQMDPGDLVNGASVPHMQLSGGESYSVVPNVGAYEVALPINTALDPMVDGLYSTEFHVNVAYWGAGANSFPAALGSYMLADQPTATAPYFPSSASAWRTDGTLETVTRSATGAYGTQAIATNAANCGGVSFVTPVGYSDRFCNVKSMGSGAYSTYTTEIRCFDVNGSPVDTKFYFATFRHN